VANWLTAARITNQDRLLYVLWTLGVLFALHVGQNTAVIAVLYADGTNFMEFANGLLEGLPEK
jgi:hypothetical protein